MTTDIPNPGQRELRRRLETRLEALEQDIEASMDESEQRAELRGEVHDEVDEALADDAGENVLTAAQRASAEYDTVQRALGRMEAGSYGLCVECGRPIEPERLRADPAVERCIDDQRRFERERHVETPSL